MFSTCSSFAFIKSLQRCALTFFRAFDVLVVTRFDKSLSPTLPCSLLRFWNDQFHKCRLHPAWDLRYKNCMKRISSISFLSACLLITSNAFGHTAAPVTTQYGQLLGKHSPTSEVISYRGIPYAAPPTNELRWKPPKPPKPWHGIRLARKFSPGCMQSAPNVRLPWTAEFIHTSDVSEDCLYLNIWAAQGPEMRKRPVLVFIHGGGFIEGSGSVPIYNGEQLARQGLVVVTLNYRLGPLGFLAHPALSAESESGTSGNYGLLDQIMALHWVQNNISAFGGDPSRVTVAGQSAGAVAARLLARSPMARGLFHRLIINSGPGALAAFGLANDIDTSLKAMESRGAEFTEKVGSHSLEELRKLPAEFLLASTHSLPGLFFTPVVDEWLVLSGESMPVAEQLTDIPMIAGLTADEGSALPGYRNVSANDYRAWAIQHFGVLSEHFLKLYPGNSDTQASKSRISSQRDIAVAALGKLYAKIPKGKNYLFYFDHAIPWPENPQFGAFHSGELPYFFSNLHLLKRPWKGDDIKLAETASTYWVRFATSGNPNHSGLPHWQQYRELGDIHVLPSRKPGSVIHISDEKLAFLNKVLRKPHE